MCHGADCSSTVTWHLPYHFTKLYSKGKKNFSLVKTKFPPYVMKLTVSFDDDNESNFIFHLEMSPVPWHKLFYINQNVLPLKSIKLNNFLN